MPAPAFLPARDFARHLATRHPAPHQLETKLLPRPPASVAADGTFEGYASLFGVPDLGRDVVERGAFAASLKARGAAGIRLLWQHDPGEPIGRWLSIAEDARGLMVRGRLNLDVARARDVHALMRDGAVDGLSIGFKAQKARTDPATGYRRLIAVDLWEISIVTFPMLPGARISGAGLLPPPCGEGGLREQTGWGSASLALSSHPTRRLRRHPPHQGEGGRSTPLKHSIPPDLDDPTLAAAIRRAARALLPLA